MKMQVFDPPMCCSTGVCGPSLDPKGTVLSKGQYPTRQVLAGFAGIRIDGAIFTDAVGELVAIGAAIASNCEMGFKHHFNQARKLGVSKDDIRLAVAMAQKVKDSPAQSITALAQKYVGGSPAKASSCCCGSSGDGESPGEAKSGKGSCC